MKDKEILAIAQIKLPLVVEVLTKANLEAQSNKPNLDTLLDYLDADAIDGFYDVSDLLRARRTMHQILSKEQAK